MKFQSCAIATLCAATATLYNNLMAQAIVAVSQDLLNQSQVIPGQFSGVVGLFESNASSSFCTGSLLAGGRHILTAAHCLQLKDPFEDILTERFPSFVSFNLSNGFTNIPISDSFIFPEWDGEVINGNDIAILLLADPAPVEAEQYSIYRDINEVGQSFTKVGYGRTGTGETGDIQPNDEFTAYFGQNQFDATEALLPNLLLNSGNPAPLSQLLYDFDNGNSQNNVFGSTGLGTSEVNTAPGDSGGPAFIGNLIAGITSYGGTTSTTDVDTLLNSSFGEFSGDTRVSTYASFIDSVIANTTPPIDNTESVPEPSTFLGLIISGVCLWNWRRNFAIYVSHFFKGILNKHYL